MGMLEKIDSEQLRSRTKFRVGDTVKVHALITEGDKTRIQIFEGTVIAMHRGGVRGTFTVRKVSYGTGVERIFPLHSPMVEKIEVVSSGRVRRARLFFLRERQGKAARLRARENVSSQAAAAPAP